MYYGLLLRKALKQLSFRDKGTSWEGSPLSHANSEREAGVSQWS